MTYKEFRKINPLKSMYNYSFIGYICLHITPLLSIFCINHKWTPNRMTLCMVITGIISGFVLMMPFLACKFLAFCGYFLWFTWDCADGEVARFTKTFSKYGQELDWVSHLSCHSLFYIAIWMSLLQKGQYNMTLLSLFSLVFLSLELIGRNLIAFDRYLFSNERFGEHSSRSVVFRYLYSQVLYFPNFVVFFPLVLFLDGYWGLGLIIYVYYIWAGLLSLYGLKEFVRYVIFFYKH